MCILPLSRLDVNTFFVPKLPAKNFLPKTIDKIEIHAIITLAVSESAGIGRQARLRGVCQMACEFKSHLSHHAAAEISAAAFCLSKKQVRCLRACFLFIYALLLYLFAAVRAETLGGISSEVKAAVRASVKYHMK